MPSARLPEFLAVRRDVFARLDHIRVGGGSLRSLEALLLEPLAFAAGIHSIAKGIVRDELHRQATPEEHSLNY
jgi:hypothetical protein